MAKKESKSSSEAVVKENNPKSKKKIITIVLAALLFVAIAGGVGALTQAYLNQKERADRLSNPAEAAKEETRLLLEKVGSLTDLPKEEPTIATVKDVTKLQNQSFFKNAQNDDKVLIFTQAKKAILYRPSSGKIIEIAPVNLGESQQGTETQSKPAVETAPAQ